MGSSSDLDEVDSSILRLLKQNSRMSFQEMSRQTGISDATIQFRLKRMRTRGVIDKFTVVVNPASAGYSIAAIILVKTDADKHDEAKLGLSRLPQISEVYSVLGEFDLFLKVWAKSLEELNAMINDEIRSIGGVEDLLEIVIVERVKEETPPI
jgi:Lrp/AsnC family transcriptional regulator, regulator for asnA, asnC and gidA